MTGSTKSVPAVSRAEPELLIGFHSNQSHLHSGLPTGHGIGLVKTNVILQTNLSIEDLETDWLDLSVLKPEDRPWVPPGPAILGPG